jgi:hypothetical protein
MTRMMQRHPRLTVLAWVAAVVLLVAGLVALGAARKHFHQWPGEAGPDRISVCGRDYIGPGYQYTLAQVTQQGNVHVGVTPSLRGDLPVWGRRETPVGASGCGTGVYVQVGSNDFRGYSMLGGP